MADSPYGTPYFVHSSVGLLLMSTASRPTGAAADLSDTGVTASRTAFLTWKWFMLSVPACWIGFLWALTWMTDR